MVENEASRKTFSNSVKSISYHLLVLYANRKTAWFRGAETNYNKVLRTKEIFEEIFVSVAFDMMSDGAKYT